MQLSNVFKVLKFQRTFNVKKGFSGYAHLSKNESHFVLRKFNHIFFERLQIDENKGNSSISLYESHKSFVRKQIRVTN